MDVKEDRKDEANFYGANFVQRIVYHKCIHGKILYPILVGTISVARWLEIHPQSCIFRVFNILSSANILTKPVYHITMYFAYFETRKTENLGRERRNEHAINIPQIGLILMTMF